MTASLDLMDINCTQIQSTDHPEDIMLQKYNSFKRFQIFASFVRLTVKSYVLQFRTSYNERFFSRRSYASFSFRLVQCKHDLPPLMMSLLSLSFLHRRVEDSIRQCTQSAARLACHHCVCNPLIFWFHSSSFHSSSATRLVEGCDVADWFCDGRFSSSQDHVIT